MSFLSSYQVFLATITGILLANYYLIGRGRIAVPDAFTPSSQGAYFFTHGWNLRAYIAYVVGIAPNFYGFLGNLGLPGVPLGVSRFYFFAYWVGLFLSGGVYWLLCKLWPVPVMEERWCEPKDYVREEELGQEGVPAAVLEASEVGSSAGSATKVAMPGTTSEKFGI